MSKVPEIGDKVRIVAKYSQFKGKTGRVIAFKDFSGVGRQLRVKLDGIPTPYYSFSEHEVEKILGGE